MRAEDIPRVRIAVIGNADVGKSALTVRYLTGRFIGEYRSNTDLLYNKTISLDAGLTEVEIVDVYAGNEDDFPVEQVLWADACMVVYNITERRSFDYATKCLGEIKALQNSPSAYLIGNKADLDHLREIPEKEGAALAAAHSLGFCEVSVAEYTPILSKAFEKLIIDSRARPQKQIRKFSVSKMLGTLIGSSGYGSSRNLAINQGTVIPCHKGELHKTRVLKRRQGFMATSSL
ncbi:ras-related and estrogen-regulated growth inhibitor-like protein [Anastrepha obliqua]|uniref:ras-related and estrogen-regulated growth inhibitor-like protein n=1 Tax=Anastrepha ludens TaxID=28586 RepID=UPI0023AFA166|nr:ras-related and estrogen-regulated growth inhibitor-like protein [Anastrepha ludens]XP_054743216.1 ras-related and estrogen-regulated growth inhibitor-like protein [Anastrepha obliqua]XP_054743217.1 ras-related and estrogen-regulated growth inhibitor-like protein [Anastrepha obliqua]